MATMSDFIAGLNTGLNNVTGTPLGQLGIQMLSNSGWTPTNQGFGQRLGNSLNGMQEMQMQQQQQQSQSQLRQLQGMEMAQRVMDQQRQLKQEQATRDYYAAHPELFNPGSAAQIGAASGATDLSPYLKIDASANPKKPYMFSQNNPDNTQTQMVWDVASGTYKPGATTVPVPQQQVNATVQNNQANQGFKQAELPIKQQSANAATANAGSAQQRADAISQTADRQNVEFLQKNNIAQSTLENGYNGVRTQMQKQMDTVDSLLKDPSLDRTFGWTGQAPTAPGSDAARVESMLDKLRANAGMAGLVQLEQLGIKLNPVSDNDFRNATNSAVSLSNRMSGDDARKVLSLYRSSLQQTIDDAGARYNNMSKAYQQTPGLGANRSQPQAPTAATPVRSGTDASGRKVIQYSDGRIEYAN